MLAAGDEDDDANSLVEKVIAGVDDVDRDKERRNLYETEMNIDSYAVEPESESCLTDFPLKEYAHADEPIRSKEELNEHLVPINYYDNEDGFWDTYIKEKHHKQEEAGLITQRLFFKH